MIMIYTYIYIALMNVFICPRLPYADYTLNGKRVKWQRSSAFGPEIPAVIEADAEVTVRL